MVGPVEKMFEMLKKNLVWFVVISFVVVGSQMAVHGPLSGLTGLGTGGGNR